ncbi:tetratricopeptide repeat protein [Streptomyces sp. TP-A0874]|uniref:tetratricopeptide repeat protein n=1 Tax=Streptomyces sp. TP-A0874 TaxID=549819 RepID=UPI000853552C|nr:tetratricopeptide repeat protein [Streptomyces sp. TP-A0874]
MTRIGQAVMLHRAGDREEARNRFAWLWEELGEEGDPVERCTLAHYMADTQDDPVQALTWDLRALAAADDGLDDARSRRRLSPAIRCLYPSLHLNLAADYDRLGRPDEARAQLARARSTAAALAEDEYGDGVRAAIHRWEQRLSGGADQLP